MEFDYGDLEPLYLVRFIYRSCVGNMNAFKALYFTPAVCAVYYGVIKVEVWGEILVSVYFNSTEGRDEFVNEFGIHEF